MHPINHSFWRKRFHSNNKSFNDTLRKKYSLHIQTITCHEQAQETHHNNFLRLNSRGKTPVLVTNIPTNIAIQAAKSDSIVAAQLLDPEYAINESIAIMHYLENSFTTPPTPPLIPPTKCQYHAKVLSLIQESENLILAYEPIETIYKKPQISIIKVALQEIHNELLIWETYLSKTLFVACNMFTLADCAFYPIIMYITHRGLSLEHYPSISKYHLMMMLRYSCVRSRPVGWDKIKTNLFEIAKKLSNGG